MEKKQLIDSIIQNLGYFGPESNDINDFLDR